MKNETESIKVSKKILNRVRRHIKKSKQTIGGFYDLAAQTTLEDISDREAIAKAKAEGEFVPLPKDYTEIKNIGVFKDGLVSPLLPLDIHKSKKKA